MSIPDVMWRRKGQVIAGLAAISLVTGVAGAVAPAASASAKMPARIHMVPRPPHGAVPAASTGPLINNGGPVQTAPRVYIDFWHWASDPSGEQPYLQNFLSSVGNTPWLASVAQYGAGWTGNLLAGTWSDTTNAVPSHPTDAQIQAEALAAANHFGVGNSVNVQIVVATPTGHSTTGFQTNWCAYHGFISAEPNVTYTNLPYMTDAGGSCGEDSVNGSNGTLDGVSIVEGHEMAETITDPLLNAWKSSDGSEIGDLCAWTGLASLSTVTGKYPVQPLYSNAGAGCAQSPAAPVTGVLTSGNSVMMKAGSLTSQFNLGSGGITQLAAATDATHGPVTGLLTSGGEAFATQGLLNAPVHEYNGVKQIVVATDPTNGPLIAVLTTGGELLVKEGGLAASWTDEESGIAQIAVASDPADGPLIGAVTTGGEAIVKEGGLSAAWIDEYSGVAQIALASDSTDGPVISVRTTSGVAYTKDGGLSTSWVHEYTGVSQIAVASDPADGPLIGVLTTGGVALVKEGGLSAAWTNENSGVSQLSLGSDPSLGPLIGVLISGAAYVKQGNLSAPWTHEYTGASEVATAG